MTGENKFWIVKSLSESGTYEMFNSVPHKEEYAYKRIYHSSDYFWYASHSNCYLGKQTLEKVSDITCDTEPVPVRLVFTDSDTPDFYIQRYRDCLFINYALERYYSPRKRKLIGWKYVECERVPHIYRISNKLFPEITEESGIVKVNIERI